MMTAIGNLTGETAADQTQIWLPRRRGKCRRFGGVLHPLNNYPNPVLNCKGHKHHDSACLKAVWRGPINWLFCFTETQPLQFMRGIYRVSSGTNWIGILGGGLIMLQPDADASEFDHGGEG
jgi:hypothetical protein